MHLLEIEMLNGYTKSPPTIEKFRGVAGGALDLDRMVGDETAASLRRCFLRNFSR